MLDDFIPEDREPERGDLLLQKYENAFIASTEVAPFSRRESFTQTESKQGIYESGNRIAVIYMHARIARGRLEITLQDAYSGAQKRHLPVATSEELLADLRAKFEVRGLSISEVFPFNE